MIDWKKLFGDADSLTLDEIEKKLAGTKLVDLSEGGYISKEKYDADTGKLKEAATAATKELDDLKAATDGDEGLKKQIATLTEQLEAEKQNAAEASSKLTKSERMAAVSAKVKDAKLARLAYLDAEALVSDTLDFDAALEKVIADDPDYTPADDDADPIGRIGTGKPIKGKPDAPDPLADALAKGLGVAEEPAE